MNQKLIKKLFIISILFNSITASSNKQNSKHQNSKHQNRQTHVNTKQHPMIQPIQQGISMPAQPMQGQIQQQGQPLVPQQVSMQTNQNLQQQQQQQQYNVSPQQNQPTMNIAQNMYNPTQPIMITSNQMAADGMSMSVIQKLDPVKAAQLIADIDTLKKNFVTLSKILEKSIKINFYSDTLPSTETQQLRKEILSFTQNGMPIFNSTKQILSLTGELTNAPAPQSLAINPYTNMPMTLLDLPILQELRRLLMHNIQNILFSIGEIDCHAWNVGAMRQYMPKQAFEWLKQPQKNKAYNQNLVRDSWRTSIEYIANGKMKIKKN